MPKLIDAKDYDGAPVGRDGLKAFCDRLNEMRRRHGFHNFYSLEEVEGVLTLRRPVGG